MKIERKWLHTLELDTPITSLDDLQNELNNNLTAKLLNKLLELYEQGTLLCWLRYHGGENEADKLAKLPSSEDKIEKLYSICHCLCDIEKKEIFYAFNGDLILDGEKIKTIEELREHPSTELLDYKRKNLSTWLRCHGGEDQADKLDKLSLSNDKVKNLYDICQAVGIIITLKDITDTEESIISYDDII